MKELSPLQKARIARAEMKEAGELVVDHNWIRRSKRKPTSLKLAIGAFCFHCFGGTENEFPDPGWKRYIRECTAPTCPLFPHRPYQVKIMGIPQPEHSNLKDQDVSIPEVEEVE